MKTEIPCGLKMDDLNVVKCWRCGVSIAPRMGYIVQAGIHPFSKDCFYAAHAQATRYMCVICVNEIFNIMGIRYINDGEGKK